MKNKIKYIKMLIKKEIPIRDRDITGTPLSPGNPKRCTGNGGHSGAAIRFSFFKIKPFNKEKRILSRLLHYI